VLLAGEPDLDLADRARDLVNGLVRRDVEARLAVDEIPEALHLTRPCRPTEATIAALRPDVVIALDPTALEQATRWCAALRATVIVELTPDMVHDVVIVPWTIGRASGQLRARVGRTIHPQALAELVNRLCSGPQPLPPVDLEPALDRSDGVGVRTPVPFPRRARSRPRPAEPRTITVHRHEPASPLLAAFADQLEAAGHVLRSGAVDPTIVWIDAVDASLDGDDPGHPDPELEAAAVRSGRAVVTSAAVASRLRALGVVTHVLPVLLARDRIAALDAAARSRVRPAAPVLGWRLGSPHGAEPDHLGAVTPGILELLDRQPDGRVEILGEAPSLPRALRDHPQVLRRAAEPDPGELAGWTAQLWTPSAGRVEAGGDVTVLAEASLAGVPTVIGAGDASAVGGLADPALTARSVRQAADWSAALGRVMDDGDDRARSAERARRAGQAIHGQAAATAAVSRFLGWLERVGAP
jgi:hypothetical protein